MEYSDAEKGLLGKMLHVMHDECIEIRDHAKARVVQRATQALEDNRLTREDLQFIQFILINVGGVLQDENPSLLYTQMLLKTAAMLKKMG